MKVLRSSGNESFNVEDLDSLEMEIKDFGIDNGEHRFELDGIEFYLGEDEELQNAVDICIEEEFMPEWEEQGIISYNIDSIAFDSDTNTGIVYVGLFRENMNESVYDATLAKVKTPTKARKIIYDTVDTKGVFDDDHWQKVTDIVDQIRSLGADVTYWPADDSRHSAGYSNDPDIPEKIYLMRIKFKNAEGKEFIIDGSIICSGCGKISDPLSMYDCTVVLFTYNLDIDEAISTDTLDSLIKDALKDSTDYLLSETYGDFAYINELAESVGYKTYGGSEYKSTALVMNVKGMPDLDLDALGLAYDVDAGDKIQLAINDFAEQLEEEFEDFTIRGRMGGYWGLANFEKNITISKDGYISLIDAVKVLLNDPTLKYKESFDEANDDNNIEEIKDIISECIYYDSNELVNNLNSDPNYIEVKPEYLAKMNELRDLIKAQEKAMQDPTYWAESKHKNELTLKEVKNGKCYKTLTGLPCYYADDSDRPANDPIGYITFKVGTEFVVISQDSGLRISIYDQDKGRNIDYKVPNYEIDKVKVQQIDTIDYSKYSKSDRDRWTDAYYLGHTW